MTNTEETTLVSEGQRTVIGISLPKNPKSPSRKVTFEPDEGRQYGPAGWTYEDQLGGISIGSVAQYRIEKNAEGFHKLVSIAPVTQGSGERDQMPANSASSSGGHDDVQGGDGGPIPAERDVPNSDTGRFEGWAFVANVGMVDLAYEELSDALEAGELDSITPELLKTVAGHLLNAADQGQRRLVGRTDRSAQSHTRARGVVRTALRKHPVRAGLGDVDAWAADLTKATTRLLLLAATL